MADVAAHRRLGRRPQSGRVHAHGGPPGHIGGDGPTRSPRSRPGATPAASSDAPTDACAGRAGPAGSRARAALPRRHPGPPRLRLRRCPVAEPSASAPPRPSRRIEERTGAQVVVYTQVKPASDYAGAGGGGCACAHRPVRRRAQGLRRRARHPVRPRRQQVPRPGAAVRRARLSRPRTSPTRTGRRSTRTTCCRTCAGATWVARWTRPSRKIDAATTAERASQLQLARQVDAATGLDPRAAGAAGPGRLGWLELAAVRPRPGVHR